MIEMVVIVILRIKGWENMLDQNKQKFFNEMEALLDKYELFGVFEENVS